MAFPSDAFVPWLSPLYSQALLLPQSMGKLAEQAGRTVAPCLPPMGKRAEQAEPTVAPCLSPMGRRAEQAKLIVALENVLAGLVNRYGSPEQLKAMSVMETTCRLQVGKANRNATQTPLVLQPHGCIWLRYGDILPLLWWTSCRSDMTPCLIAWRVGTCRVMYACWGPSPSNVRMHCHL
jgi:hypothetical protein